MRGGYPNRCIVSAMVHLLWRPGSLLRWILKRFYLGLVEISYTSWSLMSSSLLTLWTGLFWIALWGLGFPYWFCKVYFSFHSQVRLRFKLVTGLGEPWCRGGGIPQGCPLSMVFVVALYVLYCRHLDSLPDVKTQLYDDNLKCSAERPVPFLNLLGSLLSVSGRSVRTFLLVSVSFFALLSLFEWL